MPLPQTSLDILYYEFEETYRGSKDLIKKRLEFYLPLFRAYRQYFKNPKFLDIGCGRGDFLELALEEGFEVEGVEINQIYVETCLKAGLKVFHADALTFLKLAPSASYHIVALIHVIEHLELEYLFELLTEIYRVLFPGGLLIMETPYAKNPYVGLYYFWLDPTHRRPLHEDFLKFLAKKAGFNHIEILGINYFLLPPGPHHLMSIFFSPPPDLSLLLLKTEGAQEEFIKILREILIELKQKTPASLEDLIARYDSETQSFRETVSTTLNQHQALIDQHQALINQHEALINQLMTIYNSKPWRFYRWLSQTKRKVLSLPSHSLYTLYRKIERYPRLYTFLRNLINKHPTLKALLKRLLHKEASSVSSSSQFSFQEKSLFGEPLDFEEKIFLKKLLRFK